MIPVQGDIGAGYVNNNNCLSTTHFELHAGLDIGILRETILTHGDHHFLTARTVSLLGLNPGLPGLPNFKSKNRGLEAWNYLIRPDGKFKWLPSFRRIENRSGIKGSFVMDGDRIALLCLRH